MCLICVVQQFKSLFTGLTGVLFLPWIIFLCLLYAYAYWIIFPRIQTGIIFLHDSTSFSLWLCKLIIRQVSPYIIVFPWSLSKWSLYSLFFELSYSFLLISFLVKELAPWPFLIINMMTGVSHTLSPCHLIILFWKFFSTIVSPLLCLVEFQG